MVNIDATPSAMGRGRLRSAGSRTKNTTTCTRVAGTAWWALARTASASFGVQAQEAGSASLTPDEGVPAVSAHVGAGLALYYFIVPSLGVSVNVTVDSGQLPVWGQVQLSGHTLGPAVGSLRRAAAGARASEATLSARRGLVSTTASKDADSERGLPATGRPFPWKPHLACTPLGTTAGTSSWTSLCTTASSLSASCDSRNGDVEVSGCPSPRRRGRPVSSTAASALARNQAVVYVGSPPIRDHPLEAAIGGGWRLAISPSIRLSSYRCGIDQHFVLRRRWRGRVGTPPHGSKGVGRASSWLFS